MKELSEYEQRIESFNRQIEKEKSLWFIKGVTDCPSYWAKKIFMHSNDMTIGDWKKVRQGKYYDFKDELVSKIRKSNDYKKKVKMQCELNKFTYQLINKNI